MLRSGQKEEKREKRRKREIEERIRNLILH